MVFRLLYRLLMQRLDRGADAGLEASVAAGRPVRPNAAPHPRRRAALVLALVGAGGLAALVVRVLAPESPMSRGGTAAVLHLNIPAVDPTPVVVYLRGTGLEQYDIDLEPRPGPGIGPEDSPGSSPAHGPEPVAAGTIRSVEGRFSPTFQVVPRAGVLEMVNADTIAHNTHMFSRGETVFNVALPEQGVTVRKVLKGDGIFDVRCDMHPWMRAWVFVSPSPHYAVVHEPGTVAFSDLVPGEYVLHLWQPGRGERLHPLDLEAGESRHLRLR